MKRPHRRIHLVVWLLLAPATAVAAIVAWTMRPQEAFTDLPPGVEALSNDTETH